MMVVGLSMPVPSYAFFSDGSGWVAVSYLAKMLLEEYKRFEQLKLMIQESKNQDEFLHVINAGLDNIAGLLAALPIKDEKILEELKTFQDASHKVEGLYGVVPKSGEAAMQLLHDQTIAESFKLTNASKEYAAQQEANAVRIVSESAYASPKGAARINAQTSAEILHTLNQLLKVNGQMLKMQSEQFALTNKESKNSVQHFNRVNRDVKTSLASFEGDFNLPRF